MGIGSTLATDLTVAVGPEVSLPWTGEMLPSWKGSACMRASQVAGRIIPAPMGADAVVPSKR